MAVALGARAALGRRSQEGWGRGASFGPTSDSHRLLSGTSLVPMCEVARAPAPEVGRAPATPRTSMSGSSAGGGSGNRRRPAKSSAGRLGPRTPLLGPQRGAVDPVSPTSGSLSGPRRGSPGGRSGRRGPGPDRAGHAAVLTARLDPDGPTRPGCAPGAASHSGSSARPHPADLGPYRKSASAQPSSSWRRASTSSRLRASMASPRRS
jgi:hypothetical protein